MNTSDNVCERHFAASASCSGIVTDQALGNITLDTMLDVCSEPSVMHVRAMVHQTGHHWHRSFICGNAREWRRIGPRRWPLALSAHCKSALAPSQAQRGSDPDAERYTLTACLETVHTGGRHCVLDGHDVVATRDRCGGFDLPPWTDMTYLLCLTLFGVITFATLFLAVCVAYKRHLRVSKWHKSRTKYSRQMDCQMLDTSNVSNGNNDGRNGDVSYVRAPSVRPPPEISVSPIQQDDAKSLLSVASHGDWADTSRAGEHPATMTPTSALLHLNHTSISNGSSNVKNRHTLWQRSLNRNTDNIMGVGGILSSIEETQIDLDLQWDYEPGAIGLNNTESKLVQTSMTSLLASGQLNANSNANGTHGSRAVTVQTDGTAVILTQAASTSSGVHSGQCSLSHSPS